MKRVKRSKLSKIETVPFIYLWVNIIERKWYLGSRTEIGCHPSDGYICSSLTVEPMIRNNPEQWRRLLIEVGGIPTEIRNREHYLLKLLNARGDPMSYNKTNGHCDFNTEGTICINNETSEKYIDPVDLEEFLKEGWIKGRKDNTRKQIGESISKSRKENPDKWPSRKGEENNKSVEWLFISPTNDIIHGIGILKSVCEKYGLSHNTMQIACRKGWCPERGVCAGWQIFNLTTMKGTVDQPRNRGSYRSGSNNPSHVAKLKRQGILPE